MTHTANSHSLPTLSSSVHCPDAVGRSRNSSESNDMQLTDDAKNALEAWLELNTWSTDHPADMERWYDFVDRYRKDHGFEIDEAALREVIQTVVGPPVSEHLGNVIASRISLANSILDFLRHTAMKVFCETGDT